MKRSVVALSLLLNLPSIAEEPNHQSFNFSLAPSAITAPTIINDSHWLNPQQNTIKQNSFIIANSQGRLFHQNTEEANQKLLDINAYYKDERVLQLTAFALHPSFNEQDAKGQNILYTAHIEKTHVSNNFITDAPVDTSFDYQAVITEWQLSSTYPQVVENNADREVMRIGLPRKHQGFKQLGFNPHLKQWHENFGLLHIVLPEYKEKTNEKNHTQLNTPLYSGAILRINPDRFGLKHYTIPTQNPFTKKHTILDEIILFGAQEIQQVSWTKQDEKVLLIATKTKNTAQLTYSKVGENWLKKASEKVLWEQKAVTSNLSIALINNKKSEYLTLLQKSQEQWQLLTFNLNNILSENHNLWDVTGYDINTKSQLKLIDLFPHTPLIFNAAKPQFLTLGLDLNSTSKGQVYPAQESIETGSLAISIIWCLSLALLGGIGLFILVCVYMYFRKNNIKYIMRKNYSNFELKKEKVYLYKRQHPLPIKELNLNNIIKSEVLLNHRPITRTQQGTEWSPARQQKLLDRLAVQQQIKMTPDKVRKLSLLLTDDDNKKYEICLYLRKGDQRYTKIKYEQVINIIIDWSTYHCQHTNK